MFVSRKTCTNPNFLTHPKSSKRSSVLEHPLKNMTVNEMISHRTFGYQNHKTTTTPVSAIIEPLNKVLEGLDPLTSFTRRETDPLSQMAAETEMHGTNFNSEKNSKKTEPPCWSTRKSAILSKFTTTERISLVLSFLSDGDKMALKTQSTVIDKVQHRLKQLDSFDEASQKRIDLSQAEYVLKIEQLNKDLVSAWNTEQRVKALRIAIQCAKLLADTDVLSFYPSKFVLITDMLDTFGRLVYTRLRSKADYTPPGAHMTTALPENFTSDMVPDSAKETCLNWFYKVASVRELVPRLYIEMALLKCYEFISINEINETLTRLIEMINGIGNPLVAIYARCYLCRVAIVNINNVKNKQIFYNNLMNFINSYHQLFSRSVKTELATKKFLTTNYITLFGPGLDYIMETVAYNSDNTIFNRILDKCRLQGNSSLIINTMMSAFDSNVVAVKSTEILDMIEKSLDEGVPLYILLRTLGVCIGHSTPPTEYKRPILSHAWKHITALRNIDNYMMCVDAWVPYITQNFSYREINTLLSDIIDHMGQDRSHETHYNQLKLIAEKLIYHIQDFEMLLIMDNFLPFIDLFQQESVRVDVCKKILNSFPKDGQINDPVVINTLFFLCTVLHDSVNALTPNDENKQIGDILCTIIRMISYGKNFEQQLNFYVEARASFSNLDVVLGQLIQCVNTLAINAKVMIKVQTRKSSDFVRACAAYCFITIPSINSVRTRLELYLLSGRVALFTHCLGQADACFKTAIDTVYELHANKTEKSDLFVNNYFKQFLSTLLVVPDNPETNPLNLIRIFMNVIRKFQWNSNLFMIDIYLNTIDMLSVMSQETLPYHVDKVESNDVLYGSDPKFLAEIDQLCSLIIEEILIELKKIGPSKTQSYYALELFIRISIRSDLNENIADLALNLWNLSTNGGFIDLQLMYKIKTYLQNRLINMGNDQLEELINKLVLNKSN